MKKEVKIGIFAIVVLLAGFSTIEFLKGRNIFSSNRTYHVLYDHVDGIDVSTKVMLKGFRIGIVSGVDFNWKDRIYRVSLDVPRKYEIPADSRLEVYSSDLLGTKAIGVILGTSGQIAASGDTLAGSMKEDLISTVLSEVTPLKNHLDSLIQNVNLLAGTLNRIVDRDTEAEIDRILKRISSAAADLNRITASVSSHTPELERSLENLDALTAALGSCSGSISSIISNVDSISAEVRNSGLSAAIDSLKSLIIKMQDPEGSVGRLLTDDELYRSVTSLSNNLDSLVKHIEANPKRYIKLSVF